MRAIIWDFRNTIYNPDTQEFEEGALEILEKYFGKYKMVIITSTPARERRIQLIKDLGIDKYFEEIIVGVKTPELFQSICEELCVKLEEVYVIGDSYNSEIRVGNELGMKTIWFRHGNPDEEELGIKYWRRIDSLTELPDIIP